MRFQLILTLPDRHRPALAFPRVRECHRSQCRAGRDHAAAGHVHHPGSYGVRVSATATARISSTR
jgi:hypothetical protein